jgi:hypothetical protein
MTESSPESPIGGETRFSSIEAAGGEVVDGSIKTFDDKRGFLFSATYLFMPDVGQEALSSDDLPESRSAVARDFPKDIGNIGGPTATRLHFRWLEYGKKRGVEQVLVIPCGATLPILLEEVTFAFGDRAEALGFNHFELSNVWREENGGFMSFPVNDRSWPVMCFGFLPVDQKEVTQANIQLGPGVHPHALLDALQQVCHAAKNYSPPAHVLADIVVVGGGNPNQPIKREVV